MLAVFLISHETLTAVVAMRVLNTHTLQFDSRFEDGKDAYAILSHRWLHESEEVVYAEMRDPPAGLEKKAGYQKIKNACNQAIEHGFDYIWIDTCCIDKTSSAELSECINSMFRWYQDAHVCLAYLGDVPDGTDATIDLEFSASEWFTRGWTLQELVAPRDMFFFSHGWGFLGTKNDLRSTLSRITGIEEDVLSAYKDLLSLSIAKRMSWAANRMTSRPEDLAYSLMGLFDVNMPMLYGEGHKAFIRLQEEIMKTSDDHSLFAWTNQGAPDDSQYGLLAPSPACFAGAGNIRPYHDFNTRQHYAQTNRGLQISMQLGYDYATRNDVYLAALDCPMPETSDKSIAIRLKRLDGGSGEGGQYARVQVGHLASMANSARSGASDRTIFVRQNIHRRRLEGAFKERILQLRSGPNSKDYKPIATTGKLVQNSPALNREGKWMTIKSLYALAQGGFEVVAMVLIERGDKTRFGLVFASMPDYSVAFDIIPSCQAVVKDLASLASTFHPHASGEVIYTDGESITVKFRMLARYIRKYCLADVEITKIPRLNVTKEKASSSQEFSGDERGSSKSWLGKKLGLKKDT